MKQVLLRGGAISVEDVPPPMLRPGAVLVQTSASCISAGTELSSIEVSDAPLWKKALRNPAKVRRAVHLVKTQGLTKTSRSIRSQASASFPLGYSAAGIVLEVGEGVQDLSPGQRVACAGAGVANHAEVLCVPRNLVVPVPDGVDLRDAATVTLGAIALQGVRRAAPSLGETFVVLGLGMLGQLCSQILRTNGCRVIAIDLRRDRVELALSLGADMGLIAGGEAPEAEMRRLTGGHGADGVIITAATKSDQVVSDAFRMCRKKGRVVLVGDVGLDLDRADFYAKELDFLISTSYGPGRYDRNYEEEGIDYPIGYVRWTENRNMAEVLRLMADRKLEVSPLVTRSFTVDQASLGYEELQSAEGTSLTVLLTYPDRDPTEVHRRTVRVHSAPSKSAGHIRVGVIGAGAFARNVHLPNLAISHDLVIHAVANRTGANSKDIAAQYEAAYATTDPMDLLGDPDIDAVLIATRHDSHASLTLGALQAGKHVLVEKPLAIDRESLEAIADFYDEERSEPAPVLMTGFNRRFSPAADLLAAALADRVNPFIAIYRMNAGYLGVDHWVHGAEGGGRNIGEACHIYDLLTFLSGSSVRSVTAAAIDPHTGDRGQNENFLATIAFEDGSIATLGYTALGHEAMGKERLEIFCDGAGYLLDDYQSLMGFGTAHAEGTWQPADKGHAGELAAFAKGIRSGDWPIPLWQQIQATRLSFDVEDLLADSSHRAEA